MKLYLYEGMKQRTMGRRLGPSMLTRCLLALVLLIALPWTYYSILIVEHLPMVSKPAPTTTNKMMLPPSTLSLISSTDKKTAPRESNRKNEREEGGLVHIQANLSERNPLGIWESILKSSSSLESGGSKRKVVIEVGVHTPTQCIYAAELGYELHCFEPSPISYSRLENGIKRIDSTATRDNIHPHQEAVGALSGHTYRSIPQVVQEIM